MLTFAAITPHPPILIPSIGKENTKRIQKTSEAMEELEKKLHAAKPDTIIVISPHGAILPDAFSVNLNPQYKIDIIPAKGHSYPITLPMNFTGKFITFKDSIFSYKDSIFFTADNTIKSPQKSYYIPTAPTGREKLVYTVKSGDNLGFIAAWYNVGLSDLRYWNNIRGNTIRSGQNIVVYVPKKSAGKYSDINSLSFEEKQQRIGKSGTPPDEIISQPATGNYVYYTVRSGDTLWEIAKRYPGVTETEIMKLNNMTSGRSLKAGQTIKIKPKG